MRRFTLDKYLKDLITTTDLTQNEPLKTIVYKALRSAILKGNIPVGTTINQKLIADYLNVSRTPIRAAIERLKQEELLEETHHGISVKLVHVDNVSEVFQILLSLETIALTKAARNMERDDFLYIEDILANTIRARYDTSITLIEKTLLDYNHILISYAEMPQLEIFIEQLEGYILRFDNISGLSRQHREKILHGYVVLVECMKQKNEDALISVLQDHFTAAETFIITQINSLNKRAYETG
jgi:DNA-binding GntR family transcriptional regulator